MFSPWYFSARKRGPADPENHVAMNIGLYGKGGTRWTFTERPRAALSRSPEHIAIGPSAMAWKGDTLVVRLNEITCPFPSRIRGTVRLHAPVRTRFRVALDTQDQHHWAPIAPCARVEVELEQPRLSWQGAAYLDHNIGATPLADAFQRWDWSRAALPGRTLVLYEATRRDGSDLLLALECDAEGGVRAVAAPPQVRLPKGFWRVPRITRADGAARVVSTFVDAPFYARSLLETNLGGVTAHAVHESLDLDKFSMGVVQLMLPFRAPRMWQ